MTNLKQLVFAVIATAMLPVLTYANDVPTSHVYASIMNQVETGQISCCDYDVSNMTVGTSHSRDIASPFSGEVRFRWQMGKNARNTGAIPWVRTTLRYSERLWDAVDVHLAVTNDTEDGNFRFVGI